MTWRFSSSGSPRIAVDHLASDYSIRPDDRLVITGSFPSTYEAKNILKFIRRDDYDVLTAGRGCLPPVSFNFRLLTFFKKSFSHPNHREKMPSGIHVLTVNSVPFSPPVLSSPSSTTLNRILSLDGLCSLGFYTE